MDANLKAKSPSECIIGAQNQLKYRRDHWKSVLRRLMPANYNT
jgi:hypothetical protein